MDWRGWERGATRRGWRRPLFWSAVERNTPSNDQSHVYHDRVNHDLINVYYDRKKLRARLEGRSQVPDEYDFNSFSTNERCNSKHQAGLEGGFLGLMFHA
jgi:hypothetical protein